jgi:putative endonuclease
MTTPRRGLGTAGELHARRYLEVRGMQHVESNWRCPAGELDLVMRDGDELVFVEVKTRHGEGMGRAEEGVSNAQSRRLLRAGEIYVATHPDAHELIWRIDLVAITLDRSGAVRRVNHMPNAIGEW